jgi:hypothetical protein
MTDDVLTDRALNRALLARQLLIERSDRSVVDTVDLLVGMQAQAPLAPYVGLWSRLRDFAPAQLAEPLERRELVRATLMRGTVHLVRADDALVLRPLTEPAIVRGFAGGFSGLLTPEHATRVLAFGRELLAEAPRTRAELRRRFRDRWPDQDADAMAYAVSYLLPTMQPTPRGVWGKQGKAELTLLSTWLGREVADDPSIDEVVLRYLRAFGPASVKDVQAWSGLTGLGEVVERLSPVLRSFRSEDGQRLFDDADAARPDADLPVEPRFLPEYDNVLLSHHDRRRIIDDGHRVPLPPGAGARAGTFLLDGFFRGTWKIDGDAIQVAPHARLDDEALAEIVREAERLAGFLGVQGVAVSSR